MAVKDYWVYQKRDTPTPWALYVVKEYDRRKPDATTLDYTLYSEEIDTPTYSKSYVGVHETSIEGYVLHIAGKLSEFSHVEEADLQQLRMSIEDILFS